MTHNLGHKGNIIVSFLRKISIISVINFDRVLILACESRCLTTVCHYELDRILITIQIKSAARLFKNAHTKSDLKCACHL